MEKKENMKPKKSLEQDSIKPEDDQKEEDEMDIMSQYMLQPVEGLCRTIWDQVWVVEYNDISVIVVLLVDIIFVGEHHQRLYYHFHILCSFSKHAVFMS